MHWWVSVAFPVVFLAEGPHQRSVEDPKGFGGQRRLISHPCEQAHPAFVKQTHPELDGIDGTCLPAQGHNLG